jgi:elongation factor G
MDRFEGDEQLAEDAVPADAINAALRRVTIEAAKAAHGEGRVMVVLCGASRRDNGVQPLLDAVLRYLPCPVSRPQLTGLTNDLLAVDLPPPTSARSVAFVFKVMHFPNAKKGNELMPLSFFRIYSGKLQTGMRVRNQRTGKEHPISQLFVMHANEMRPVKDITAGCIGAAFLDKASTGDTLMHEHRHLFPERGKVMDTRVFHSLEPIATLPPVLSHAVEPQSSREMEPLRQAVACLAAEDPTLLMSENEHGQLIISGMGELHIEIVMSRLKREFHLDCELTRAIVEYREGIDADHSVSVADVVGRCDDRKVFTASIDLVPALFADEQANSVPVAPTTATNTAVRFDSAALTRFESQRKERLSGMNDKDRSKTIANDVRNVLDSFSVAALDVLNMGPRSLKLVGVQFVITDFELVADADRKVLDQATLRVLSQVVKAIRQPRLYEPLMDMDIHLTESLYIGDVMRSLNTKQATFAEVQDDGLSIKAVVPMRNIVRYAAEIRKAAKGNVYFWTTLRCYRAVPTAAVEQKILANMGRA